MADETHRGDCRFFVGQSAYDISPKARSTPSGVVRPRSSSATAPSTVKTILPVGALVSTCSDGERALRSQPRTIRRMIWAEISRTGRRQQVLLL
jgi:hypothetical protein